MTQTSRERVLVVDDDAGMLEWLSDVVRSPRIEVKTARTGGAATQILDTWAPDAVVTDMRLPDISGLDVLQRARQREAPPEVIMLTGHGSVPEAVKAMREGALTFLEKPVAPEALVAMVDRALEQRRLRAENRHLREQVTLSQANTGIIGRHPSIVSLLDTIARIAPSEANCLILGENGTGKELIANAIHRASARARAPFIKVNCAAIPSELMEAELFGHRRGAFTGAISDKVGLFEMANGGSLLLDEIGEMPAYLQSKLLRVLQEREIRPVGGTRNVVIDVRLICATNVRIDEALAEGRLRSDLYFRINTVTLRNPALRQRTSDIPLLVEHFIAAFRKRYDKTVKGITAEALSRLQRHHWPGNVRELENVIERAVVLAKGESLDVGDLPEWVGTRSDRQEPHEQLPPATLADLERMAIVQTLQQTNWNKQEAALLLGIYRPTLYSKMQHHNIEDPRRRRGAADRAVDLGTPPQGDAARATDPSTTVDPGGTSTAGESTAG